MSAASKAVRPKGRKDARARAAANKAALDALEQLEETAREAGRQRSDVFASLILRDEKTNQPVELCQMHIDWHDALAAHKRSIIWAFPGSGKTSNLAVAWPLFKLGQNPNLRIVIASATKTVALKRAKSIAGYVKRGECARIFPRLKPGPKWSPESGVIEIERDGVIADPSVQCLGMDGQGGIIGSRVDILILDDVLTSDNTRTKHRRQDMLEKIRQKLFSRIDDQTIVIMLGNVFHPADALHVLAKEHPNWYSANVPVQNANGVPIWPERFGPSVIAQALEDLGPLAFAQLFMGKARDDKEARFQVAWIEACKKRGNGRYLSGGWRDGIVPDGIHCYTGVDLAVSKKDSADETCLFTIAVYPNGDRLVLNIEAGRWDGPEILEHIVDTHRRYGSIIWVESNAAQDYIRQFVKKDHAVPVHALFTGENKYHPDFGIESIAVELYNAKWIIPNHAGVCFPEVQKWLDEALFYSPIAHTGDRLMAAWIAREAARRGTQVPKGVNRARG